MAVGVLYFFFQFWNQRSIIAMVIGEIPLSSMIHHSSRIILVHLHGVSAIKAICACDCIDTLYMYLPEDRSCHETWKLQRAHM